MSCTIVQLFLWGCRTAPLHQWWQSSALVRAHLWRHQITASVQTPGRSILIPVPKWHTRKNWTDKIIFLKYPPFIKYPTIVLSYRESIKKNNGKKPHTIILNFISQYYFYMCQRLVPSFFYVIISNDVPTLSNKAVTCHMLKPALLQRSMVKETKEMEAIVLCWHCSILEDFIAVVSASIRSQEHLAVYYWVSENELKLISN